MSKEITIYDIAKETGVSPATVSRALNKHPAVKEKTKKKIYEAADKLGYRSNIFASNLRSKSTHNIGVIVPRLNSPFQSSVLAGMEKVANEAGFNLIISQSLESEDKEKSNAKSMYNSRVDGLLVSLASSTKEIAHFKPFLQKGTPVIFFDRVAEESNMTGVMIDNSKAAYHAVKHLIDQGCKNIVHVLGNPQINVYADRLKGYKYALMDNGIAFEEDNIIISDLNETAGIDISRKILSMNPLPDGLFVSNDSCAASCLIQLKKAGVKIPKDMAVVGFNNDTVSRLIAPNLTTINYPGYEMGEIAMKNLITRLNETGDDVLQNTNTITLKADLIIRDSSLRKKNRNNIHH
ncbi:LacI family transcriptional regulator [Echinicola marina]|uniref:LacI family DNA-binding transcriptional regulator n=1 Tax=Echinicola marina TaxID=2859768 RepID=UPI001CF67FA4|nr:LacI family DNA-binding transcriptional regulator [Echinicola marina]UCS92125.1 LacI family transcriptional regulator [Echinicola marina]